MADEVLQKMREEIARQEANLVTLKREYTACIHAFTTSSLGITLEVNQMGMSHWDCEASPSGKCIYDLLDDDECCLFCGNPEERK